MNYQSFYSKTFQFESTKVPVLFQISIIKRVCYLNETGNSFVTYTKHHEEIVNNGVDAINAFLINAKFGEKRSLLFCLDKYLDPYYGYNLPFFDEVISVLEKHLLIDHDKEVKEDILRLLTEYSKDSLDYLADNIEQIDYEFLADAIYALGLTFNKKYIPILITYENHNNVRIQYVAKEAIEIIRTNL